jgi:hypothetical protein
MVIVMSDRSLDQRIAAALNSDVSSADLAALVQETEAAAIAVAEAAARARTRALDPGTADPSEAKSEMIDAEFSRDRLNAALPRLQQRYIQTLRRAQKAAWIARYDELRPRVESAAAELKAVYTEFVPKLAAALAYARELDQEVRACRESKPVDDEPFDGRRLLEVELVARNISGIGDRDFGLDRDLVLPDFDKPREKIWPPLETPSALRTSMTSASSYPMPEAQARWLQAQAEREARRQVG